MMGRGDGTFVNTYSLSVGNTVYGSDIILADVDRDGFLDALYSGQGDGAPRSLYVLPGTGTGQFQLAREYPTEGNCFTLTAMDFDADGWMDVLCTNAGTDSVSLLLGTGQGKLAPAQVFGGHAYAVGELAVLDADGDGLLDILTAGGGMGANSGTLIHQR
jgi:hypothetical protein